MRKHLRECRDICTANGLTVLGVEHRGKHPAIICAEGRVVGPGTPGDKRWRYKATSFVRRMARGDV